MSGRLAAPLAALVLFCASAHATDAPLVGGDSHLPVPRFVSLKTDGANGRRGPGPAQPVQWIYQRVGLPMLVTGESGPWRRVRDPDGAETWVHASSLDEHRTALVRGAHDTPMRSEPRNGARVAAYLAPGVIASLTGCDGGWRRVVVSGRVGWVEKSAIWGADADCSTDSH